MGYTIGVSSGIFRAVSEEQKGEYVGLPSKSMFSMFKGVMFTQLDLESISEFKEPNIEKKMKDVREKMGIQYGLHGEVPEYSDAFPKLDSALMEEWKRSHARFIAEIEGSSMVKAKYLLFHASTSDPFFVMWREFQTMRLCDIWGRPLADLLKENDWLLEWAIEQEFIVSVLEHRRYLDMGHARAEVGARYEKTAEEEIRKGKKPEEIKMPTKEELEEEAVKQVKEAVFATLATDDTGYGTERVAYYIIAKWMQNGGKSCPAELHTLWNDITGGGSIDDPKFRDKYESWVPAVTAAYHWGHFYPERCPNRKSPGTDPKPILAKTDPKMKLVFETPMAGKGGEETVRLAKASHIYYMVKAINHPLIGVAVDAEHMLSANIDPKKDIESMPYNAGEKVFVMHVGYPAPLAPAHLPIPVGSEAQVYVYEILWMLRKKGMKDAIIIFERGGGQEPVKESILSLRIIVKYLEMDVPPDKLPEEFFGMPRGGPEFSRQVLSVRDHALDPLKGLLTVPEEDYGFLGTAAQAKGKLEEWSKRKLK